MIVVDPFVEPQLESLTAELKKAGTEYLINNKITKEPSVSDFKILLEKAEENSIDSVIGIGGVRVLDVSKLLAAICHSEIRY